MRQPRWPAVDCLGVNVSRPTWRELQNWFAQTTDRERRGDRAAILYFTNAHTLNLAASDRDYQAVLGRADVVLNDGFGIELFARLARRPFHENFNGTDLFPRLFRELQGELRVFLYGGVTGRAERAAARLEATYPAVRVVGTAAGFGTADVIDDINAASPDLLLVGLGNPLQERWIDAHATELDVGLAAGVGALMDFLSGEVPRAPAALRRARLEWAYRLALEPRRMFKRYVIGNPLFLARAIRYLVRRPI